jgi:hypothetical protein
MRTIDRGRFSATLSPLRCKAFPSLREGENSTRNSARFCKPILIETIYRSETSRATNGGISITDFLIEEAAHGGGDVISRRAAVERGRRNANNKRRRSHSSLARAPHDLHSRLRMRGTRGTGTLVRIAVFASPVLRAPVSYIPIATQAQVRLSAVAAFAAASPDFSNSVAALARGATTHRLTGAHSAGFHGPSAGHHATRSPTRFDGGDAAGTVRALCRSVGQARHADVSQR